MTSHFIYMRIKKKYNMSEKKKKTQRKMGKRVQAIESQN